MGAQDPQVRPNRIAGWVIMASLIEIEEGIGNTLKAVYDAVPDEDEVNVYDTVPDVSQTPAIVVMPAPRDTADFNRTMGRGTDEWVFDVIVMVARGEYSVSQKALAKFIDGRGPFSVREILYFNPTLGIGDEVDANCDGVRLYGGEFENAKIPHVGAVLKVTVRNSGP